jgi:hypothetical protein
MLRTSFMPAAGATGRKRDPAYRTPSISRFPPAAFVSIHRCRSARFEQVAPDNTAVWLRDGAIKMRSSPSNVELSSAPIRTWRTIHDAAHEVYQASSAQIFFLSNKHSVVERLPSSHTPHPACPSAKHRLHSNDESMPHRRAAKDCCLHPNLPILSHHCVASSTHRNSELSHLAPPNATAG